MSMFEPEPPPMLTWDVTMIAPSGVKATYELEAADLASACFAASEDDRVVDDEWVVETVSLVEA